MTIVRNVSKGHVDSRFDLGVIKKTGGGGGAESKFSCCKSCENGDIVFPICHVTSGESRH